MIQIVGLMIGCYIVLQSLALYTRRGERQEPQVVRVAALIVIVAVLLLMGTLLTWDLDGTVQGVTE